MIENKNLYNSPVAHPPTAFSGLVCSSCRSLFCLLRDRPLVHVRHVRTFIPSSDATTHTTWLLYIAEPVAVPLLKKAVATAIETVYPCFRLPAYGANFLIHFIHFIHINCSILWTSNFLSMPNKSSISNG